MKTRASQVLSKEFAVRGRQLELSAETGISQSWLSRLANDAVANREDGLKLKEALGIELEWWDQPPLAESSVGTGTEG